MRRPPVPPGEPTGLNKERAGTKVGSRNLGGETIVSDAPSWKPHPGDGQVVGMVNTCESVIKIVMGNEPKWLSFGKSGSGQNGNVGQDAVLNEIASWMTSPPVDSGHLTPHMLRERNVETPYTSRRCRGEGVPFGRTTEASSGGGTVRCRDRCAGLRCRKKRMPRCNGADTGCSLTGRESGPTSDWSFIAR